MITPREAFLERVRQAVQAGNRAGTVPPLPERNAVGYQGAGIDPAATFCRELGVAGGVSHRVADRAQAVAKVLDLTRTLSAHKVLLGSGPILQALDLRQHLEDHGMEVATVGTLDPATSRDAFFTADVGISGVAHLIAETGSIVVKTRADEPRSLTLLPPVHIAIAERSQLVEDVFDLFESPLAQPGQPMPSCLTLITGPSKTGDIELRLVTGVHGPGEVHVVLID